MRHTTARTLWSGGLASILLLGAWGCGTGQPTGDIVDTASAAGVLTYKGEPLEFYRVTVMPHGGRPAMGLTDAQGNFVLGTNAVGDGATPGTHPVAVQYEGPPSNDPAEGMTVFTKPPAPKVKIPRKYNDPATSGITVEIPAGGTKELKIELQ